MLFKLVELSKEFRMVLQNIPYLCSYVFYITMVAGLRASGARRTAAPRAGAAILYRELTVSLSINKYTKLSH